MPLQSSPDRTASTTPPNSRSAIGRLLAYALPNGAGNPTQRELIDRAMAYRALPDRLRGTAQTLKPLGKAHNPAGDGWASPGADYGMKIAAVARQISSH